MSIANNISSDEAKELISLIDEREALQARLDSTCGRIASLLETLAGRADTRRGSRALEPWITPMLQRGGEGSPIGKRIFALLEERKAEGATIDEIVALFNRSRPSVHVWFSSAIRRKRGIVRVGLARYALEKYVQKADAPAPAPAAAVPASASE